MMLSVPNNRFLKVSFLKLNHSGLFIESLESQTIEYEAFVLVTSFTHSTKIGRKQSLPNEATYLRY